jgi:NADPH2:quinone reductase
MQVVRIHEQGGPEVIRLEDVPTPEPGAGQARVKIEAAGVNFLDIYHRSGQYKVPLPFSLGQEGAGTVEAVGPDVSIVKAGDRVAWHGIGGSYATQVVAPADRLVPLPSDVSFDDGAASMLQGMTAHYLIHSTYPLKDGETCLIHAAAGGVGLLLVQMARMRGATVIATVGTDEKAALAREAGADHVIVYTRQDFAAEVKRITNGAGVQVVYDGVGKDVFEQNLEVLAPRGYEVLFGGASGPVPPIDPLVLMNKGSLFLTRPTLGSYTATRDELMWRGTDILDWIQSGKLKLRVDRVFKLAEAGQAHEALRSRQTTGKLLLKP